MTYYMMITGVSIEHMVLLSPPTVFEVSTTNQCQKIVITYYYLSAITFIIKVLYTFFNIRFFNINIYYGK